MNILYRTVTTVTYTRIDGKGSSKTSIIIGNNEVVQKESLISQAHSIRDNYGASGDYYSVHHYSIVYY